MRDKPKMKNKWRPKKKQSPWLHYLLPIWPTNTLHVHLKATDRVLSSFNIVLQSQKLVRRQWKCIMSYMIVHVVEVLHCHALEHMDCSGKLGNCCDGLRRVDGRLKRFVHWRCGWRRRVDGRLGYGRRGRSARERFVYCTGRYQRCWCPFHRLLNLILVPKGPEFTVISTVSDHVCLHIFHPRSCLTATLRWTAEDASVVRLHNES